MDNNKFYEKQGCAPPPPQSKKQDIGAIVLNCNRSMTDDELDRYEERYSEKFGRKVIILPVSLKLERM